MVHFDIKGNVIYSNRTLHFFIHIMEAHAEINTVAYDIILFHATECEKVDP